MAKHRNGEKGEIMREFFGIYQIARRKYGLKLVTKKSIYGQYMLKIYQGERLIIKIDEENEATMYEAATRALKFFILHNEDHAARSTKKGEENGK